MNDEIALCELCHGLTDDKIIRQKLHDDYSYQLNKPGSNLYKVVKTDNRVKPKKKSSQVGSEYQMVDVITVKADEFYHWAVERLRMKKLPEDIRDNIPKKYATIHLEPVAQVSTPSSSVGHITVLWGRNNTTNEYHYNFMIKEIAMLRHRLSTLEDEKSKLRTNIIELEDELAEATPKAEKWDNWLKNKGRHKT